MIAGQAGWPSRPRVRARGHVEFAGLKFLLQLLPATENNGRNSEILLPEETPIQGQGQGSNIEPRQIAKSNRGRRCARAACNRAGLGTTRCWLCLSFGFALVLTQPALLLQKADQFGAQAVIIGVFHHL